MTLRRDTAVEDTAVIPLDRYEDGLTLVPSVWAPFGSDGSDPLGRLTIGAQQLGTRPLPGVSLEATLEGDAGFIPAMQGTSQLPEGCMAGQETGSPTAGGLPTTVVCDLGELAPGGDPQLRNLVVLVRREGQGGDTTDGAPTATVVLRLQDPVVDPNVPPLVHDIAQETIVLDLPEG